MFEVVRLNFLLQISCLSLSNLTFKLNVKRNYRACYVIKRQLLISANTQFISYCSTKIIKKYISQGIIERLDFDVSTCL